MQAVFARFGPPDVVFSDNGPQFSSEDFAEFAKDWSFQHRTSSPEFPQSNGMAESAVKSMKNIVKKAENTNAIYKGLLAYRTTALEHGYAPATVLMGRNIRTTLPMHPSKLTTDFDSEFAEQKRLQHAKQKAYFDQGKRDLKELKTGDRVRLLDSKSRTWPTSATVTEEQSPRSYLIRTDNGAVYRRNRAHLKQIPRPADLEPQPEKISLSPPETPSPSPSLSPIPTTSETANITI